ncbi:hypothetical protein CASFOL_038227 [Castilleja foliolosa]|uniref:DCL protein n=1 Tax=Castilleja foliolosa TaxID=1961234 RepID=A0ABD3BLL5_9LAMI
MATPLLLRTLPLLRRRLAQPHVHLSLSNASTSLRPFCSAATATESTGSDGDKSQSLTQVSPSKNVKLWDDPEFRKWKVKESEILEDIEPIICLTKEILHFNRYMDGDRLSPDDEKAVVDKLLAHHPHSEDKIGVGLDWIMVDRHPQFKNSRCLFVVRTDGGWIDFSYQKCLRGYIRDKYPSYADRFIKKHFKRGSS